jgi:hypothetical protein
MGVVGGWAAAPGAATNPSRTTASAIAVGTSDRPRIANLLDSDQRLVNDPGGCG